MNSDNSPTTRALNFLKYDPDKIDSDRESVSFPIRRAMFDRESLAELLKILNAAAHEE